MLLIFSLVNSQNTPDFIGTLSVIRFERIVREEQVFYLFYVSLNV